MKLKEQFNDIILPIKYLDSKIHRSYQKIGNKLESKGVNKSKLPSYLSTPNIIYTLISSWFTIFPFIVNGYISFFRGVEFGLNTYDSTGSRSDGIEETKNGNFIIGNPKLYNINIISKINRLPTFLTGLFLTGKSIVDVFNNSYLENIGEFTDGLSLLFYSSSVYLRDNNPAISEKQPMWKDALNLAKRLLPKPIPEPATVQAYSTLDDKF